MENREEHLAVVKEVMRPLEFTVRQSDRSHGLFLCFEWDLLGGEALSTSMGRGHDVSTRLVFNVVVTLVTLRSASPPLTNMRDDILIVLLTLSR